MSVEVPIDFFARFDQATDQFSQFKNSIGAQVGDIQNKFSLLGGVLATVAAAFTVSKIIGEMKEMVNEANDADKTINKLRNSLRASGDYSEQNVKAFEDLAQAIAETSKFGKDEVLQGYALAKSFNVTNDEAERLVDAATKLSKVTGKDLSDSVNLLGRSLDGTAGKLNETVPGVRALTQDQLVAGAAIDLVAERFAAASDEALPTYAGALNQIAKKSKEFRVELGNVIVQNPVVIQAIQGVADIYFELKKEIAGNKDGLRDWVSGGVIFAVEAIGFLVEALRATDQFIQRVRVGFLVFTNGFSTEGLEKQIDAITNAEEKRGAAYDSVSTSLANLVVKMEQTKATQTELTKETEKTKKGFDDLAPSVKRVSQELISQFNGIRNELKTIGSTESEKAEKEYAEKIRILDKGYASGLVLEVGYQQARAEIDRAYTKKIIDARDNELKALTTDPFKNLFGDPKVGGLLGLSKAVQDATARGLCVVGDILNGQAGAKKLLGGIAEDLGKAFLGIPGFGALFDALSQGPEKIKEMITEFAKAIPDLLLAVAEAIPAAIESIGENFDVLIERIADHAPQIAIAIARAMTISVPIAIATAIRNLLASSLNFFTRGIGEAGQKLVDGAREFVGKILDGAGQFIQKLIDGIGKAVDKVNPIGGNFLGGGDAGKRIGGGVIGAIVAGPIGAIGGAIGVGGGEHPGGAFNPQNWKGGSADQVPIKVMIGHKQLGEAMVDLSRYGYRTKQ